MEVNFYSLPLELRQHIYDYHLSGTVVDIPIHIGQSYLYDFRDGYSRGHVQATARLKLPPWKQLRERIRSNAQPLNILFVSKLIRRELYRTAFSRVSLRFVNDVLPPRSLRLSPGKSDVARFFQKVLDSPITRGLMKHTQTIALPLCFDEAWRFYMDERYKDHRRLKAVLFYDDSLRYRSSDADPEMLALVKSTAEQDLSRFMNGVRARDLQDFAQDHGLDVEVCAPAGDEACGIRISEDQGTHSMQLLFRKADAIPIPFYNLPSKTWQIDRSAELRETQWFQSLLRRGKRKHKGRRLDRVGRTWGREKPWPYQAMDEA